MVAVGLAAQVIAQQATAQQATAGPGTALHDGRARAGTGELSSTRSTHARPVDAWRGTATVRRYGGGLVDGKADATHDEQITYTFRPDGTASYRASYETRISVPPYPAIKMWGTATGDTTWRLEFGRVALASPGALCGPEVREDGCAGWAVRVSDGDVDGQTDAAAAPLAMRHLFAEMMRAMASGQQHQVAGIDGFSPGLDGARVVRGQSSRAIPAMSAGNLVALQEEASWQLSRVSVDADPVATIYGPACGCIDADQPDGKTFTFLAAATHPGGEFSAFQIAADKSEKADTPNGELPDVVSNVGGSAPRLVLHARPSSSAVTIRITYMLNGARFESKPFRLEFCAMQAITLEGDGRDRSFGAKTSRLDVRGRVDAWHNGRPASDLVRWTMDRMGEPTVLTVRPSSAAGPVVEFSYRGLPRRNDDFGAKTIRASVDAGACACARETRVRVFYPFDATNNPGGHDPNWFYYWAQTDAVPAEAKQIPVRHELALEADPGAVSARTVVGRWDARVEAVLVGDGAARTCATPMTESLPHVPSGRPEAEGIDCFAEVIRHELRHRLDFIEWWGSPKGPMAVSKEEWSRRDPDLDQVPTDVEARLPGCLSGDPTRDNKYSCEARPQEDVPDVEMRAYYTGWKWPIGSLDHKDWSCGGPSSKQFAGPSCE